MPRAALSAASVAALVGLAVPRGAAHAQRADRLRAGPTAVADRVVAVADTSRGPVPGAPVLRGLAAVGGWAAGAYAGAYVAYGLRHRNGGDLEGLGEALLGATLGGALGAAAGAAIPTLGSSCPDGRRFGHAVGGAAVGMAVGLIGLAGGYTVLITIPVGSVVGAAAGASQPCRSAAASR